MNEKVKELRERFTDLFANALTDEPRKWRKEWFSARMPFNAVSKTEYRGFNRFMLSFLSSENGWDDPRFMTFKQALDKGTPVKKGSKGTKVEFWSPYDKEARKTVTWAEMSLMDPEKKKDITFIARTFTVFNGSQLEGLPEYKDSRVTNVKPNEAVLKMAESMGVKVRHAGSSAFYRPGTDEVTIPPADHFESESAYASTLAHELSHATGAGKRLNRDQGGSFGNEDYAREELVAEMAACYICAELGIEMTDEHINNHQAYVQNWARAVREDPNVLTDSIKKAEEASDLLMVHAGLMSPARFEELHKKPAVGIDAETWEPAKAVEESGINDKDDSVRQYDSEGTDAPAPGMVYIPPHTREGVAVKGYWRKKGGSV